MQIPASLASSRNRQGARQRCKITKQTTCVGKLANQNLPKELPPLSPRKLPFGKEGLGEAAKRLSRRLFGSFLRRKEPRRRQNSSDFSENCDVRIPSVSRSGCQLPLSPRGAFGALRELGFYVFKYCTQIYHWYTCAAGKHPTSNSKNPSPCGEGQKNQKIIPPGCSRSGSRPCLHHSACRRSGRSAFWAEARARVPARGSAQ